MGWPLIHNSYSIFAAQDLPLARSSSGKEVDEDALQVAKALCDKNPIKIPGGFMAYWPHTDRHTDIGAVRPTSNISLDRLLEMVAAALGEKVDGKLHLSAKDTVYQIWIRRQRDCI